MWGRHQEQSTYQDGGFNKINPAQQEKKMRGRFLLHVSDQSCMQHFFCSNTLQQLGSFAVLVLERISCENVGWDRGQFGSQSPTQTPSDTGEILKRKVAVFHRSNRPKNVVKTMLCTWISITKLLLQIVTYIKTVKSKTSLKKKVILPIDRLDDMMESVLMCDFCRAALENVVIHRQKQILRFQKISINEKKRRLIVCCGTRNGKVMMNDPHFSFNIMFPFLKVSFVFE